MGIQRYSIIYSSKTGNTKKLAEKIREVLPEENCDYFGTEGAKALSSDILYIGFWTDIGNADPATLELLKSLKNKKIFLFGTAGFGGSEAYFQQVLGKGRTVNGHKGPVVAGTGVVDALGEYSDGRIYVSGENAPVSQEQIRKDEREAGSCAEPG